MYDYCLSQIKHRGEQIARHNASLRVRTTISASMHFTKTSMRNLHRRKVIDNSLVAAQRSHQSLECSVSDSRVTVYVAVTVLLTDVPSVLMFHANVE
jgi:hypothetical protein